MDIQSQFPLFPQVLLLACAEDLECTPGFQQKVFYIEQPFEFTEDQPILNRMLFSYISLLQKSESLICSYHSCHLSESFLLYIGVEYCHDSACVPCSSATSLDVSCIRDGKIPHIHVFNNMYIVKTLNHPLLKK